MAESDRECRMADWVDRYSDTLLRFCFIQLQDRVLAEDALQETFIKAWRAMPRYEQSAIQNDKAWLSRIALNVCRDMRRSGWMRHMKGAVAIDALPLFRGGCQAGQHGIHRPFQIVCHGISTSSVSVRRRSASAFFSRLYTVDGSMPSTSPTSRRVRRS